MTQRTWQQNLDRLVRFVNDHGRLPGRGKSASREEISIRHWMVAQRKSANAERAALLDEHAPGWRGYRRRTTDQILSDLEKFIAEHGRLPMKNAALREERTLRAWLTRQKDNPTSSTTARRLDQIAPGWRNPTQQRRSRRFAEMAAELGQFVSDHGRLPSDRGTAEESRLYTWVNGQLATASTHERSVLDFVAPGWDQSRPAGRPRDDERFEERLAELLDFVRSNGRLPLKTTESALAGWLRRQATFPDRLERITAALPPEFRPSPPRPKAHLRSFQRRVAELSDFYRTHGRLPRQNAPTSAERILGVWLKRRRAEQIPGDVTAINAVVPGAANKGGFQAGRARRSSAA